MAPKRKQKTNQRTINDMLSQFATGTSNDKEDHEACSSTSCTTDESEGVVITWVGCKNCGLWYHWVCAGLGDKSQAEINQIEYICNDGE